MTNKTMRVPVAMFVGSAAFILSSCETHIGSGQVMCWTEGVLNAAQGGMAPMHSPPQGVVYAYDPGVVDLICIPIVSRRVGGQAGAGGNTITPPQPPPPHPPAPPAVEGAILGNGTFTFSTPQNQASGVPSAVNPGQMNVAAETTNPNGSFADAIIDSVFNDFGMGRSN